LFYSVGGDVRLLNYAYSTPPTFIFYFFFLNVSFILTNY